MNAEKNINYVGIVIVVILVIGATWLSNRYQKNIDVQQAYKVFSSDTTGLPDATSMPTVELKDGDTYNLVAQEVRKNINGQVVKMLGYNGSIPGPLIKVKQGSEITVNFTNDTDVETTLHSHGVRVDNAFDGIPGVTQDAIPVGGSFTYHLKFPDAGIYWYHPHVREDYAQELGLYGNFLVEPQDVAYWPPVNREEVVVLDDILLENGKIASFNEDDASHTLMGRFGNVMLINGDTSLNLIAKSGEVVRLFITNTANTRTFKFGIPGAKMKLIGSDGGAYERETFVESVIISPSERATVDVLFESEGVYSLQHRTPTKTYSLGSATVSNTVATPSYVSRFKEARVNEFVQSELIAFRPLLTKVVEKSLRIGIDMGMMNMMQGADGRMMFNGLLGADAFAQMSDPTAGHMMPDGSMMGGNMMMGGSDPIEWEDDMGVMNSSSNKESVQWKLIDEATNLSNMDINWKFTQGDKVKLRITNDANSMHPMQHPIHLHGQRFLVTSTNGVLNNNLAWKDTALVQTGDTVELLVDMTNPGEWMLHCHIAEHLEDGMMMQFTVVP